MKPGPYSEYPRELLVERAHVLSELGQMPLPTIKGSVVDSEGTKSHEQGIRVDQTAGTAELSIVDTTAFEPGGYTDAYGLVRVSSIYNNEADNARTNRLFTDPVLYKRLNMTNPDGCPAVRVSFTQGAEGWEVSGIDRVRFFAGYVGTQDATPRDRRIKVFERELTTALGQWMSAQDAEFHIGYIRSQDGEVHANAPLRQWTDFKNLQILTRLYADRSSQGVLTHDGHRQAQAHILGDTTIPDVESAQHVLAQTMDTERHLITMLGVPDITKYMLSTEAFRVFCEAILSEEVDVRKITGIGRLIGIIQVHDTEYGQEVTAGGKTQIVENWEEFLVTMLQRTDRGDNTKSMRDRKVMAEAIRRQREMYDERANPVSVRAHRLARAQADRLRSRSVRYRNR